MLFTDTIRHKFQPPPQRRKLPSAKLLRKAFLIGEAENIEDYRALIMSTFGKVLKFDSTKKVQRNAPTFIFFRWLLDLYKTKIQ